MKKKVRIIFSVLLIFSVLVCGCSNNNSQGGNNSNNQSSGSNSQESGSNAESEIVTIDDNVYLDGESFPNHIKTIEMTKENWKDYLELVREEKTDTHTDAFGEVISTNNYACYYLKIKDIGQFTCGLSSALIEFTDIQSGEVLYFRESVPYYSFSLSSEAGILIEKQYNTDETRTIDDFECMRIKGEIIFIMDIPQEVLRIDDRGREFFFVRCEVNGRDENWRFDNYRNKKDEGITPRDVELFLD